MNDAPFARSTCLLTEVVSVRWCIVSSAAVFCDGGCRSRSVTLGCRGPSAPTATTTRPHREGSGPSSGECLLQYGEEGRGVIACLMYVARLVSQGGPEFVFGTFLLLPSYVISAMYPVDTHTYVHS